MDLLHLKTGRSLKRSKYIKITNLFKFFLSACIAFLSNVERFRQRAGLPANDTKDMGGWHTNDAFHVFVFR